MNKEDERKLKTLDIFGDFEEKKLRHLVELNKPINNVVSSTDDVEDILAERRKRNPPKPPKSRKNSVVANRKPTVVERLRINENYKIHVKACLANQELPADYDLFVEESVKDPDLMAPPQEGVYEGPHQRYDQYFAGTEKF